MTLTLFPPQLKVRRKLANFSQLDERGKKKRRTGPISYLNGGEETPQRGETPAALGWKEWAASEVLGLSSGWQGANELLCRLLLSRS